MATWIFLRGLTRESRHWGTFSDEFQTTFPGQTVVPLDFAGNGLQNHRSSASRVQGMVEDCRTQLAQRNISGPFHVLALSLGAMVSVSWAQSYPHEVAAQVLINTSMRPFSPFYQRLQPPNYIPLLRLLLGHASPATKEQAILRMTSNRNDNTVLASWLQIRQDKPVTPTNAMRQLFAAALFVAPSASPPVPTLLLASAQDHLVSANCSRSLAKHWQCPLRMHLEAGHDLPLDDGPWVAAQIERWLETLLG